MEHDVDLKDPQNDRQKEDEGTTPNNLGITNLGIKVDAIKESGRLSIQQQLIDAKSPIAIEVTRPKAAWVPRDHIGDETPTETLVPTEEGRSNGLQNIQRIPAPPEVKGERQYRTLYKELKRVHLILQQSSKKLEEERDTLNGKLSKFAAESDNWREKCKLAENDSTKKIEHLTAENQNISKTNEQLQSEMEEMKTNYERIIAEKDELLKGRSPDIGEEISYHLRKITSEENIVRLKPKAKKAKSINAAEKLSCEFENCGGENVDLILCNMCNKWVCEDCNDVQVAKLKPILNRCKTIHFLCKKCDDRIGNPMDKGDINLTNEGSLLTSLKDILDKKVTQMESTIEKVIDKKLGEKMAGFTTQEDTSSDGETGERSTSGMSFAKVLQVPAEVRKVMQEVRNDEKVELSEQEKRSQNFIIHGAEEIGENADEIKGNDKQYIKDILEKLQVNAEAKSVTRLGQPNEKKMRVLKVVMKSEADKDNVMANLRRLKGTEDDFGKISVTSDYTRSERDKINEFLTKAKRQNEEDPTRVHKVRGDPKNGLRIISFKRE